jgi:DNA-binding MarR family transcriptional regulator
MSEDEGMPVEKIIENLFYIHPLVSKSLTHSVRVKTNLNPGTLYILGILSKCEKLSMSEIGCKLSMPKPHVTVQVDKLIDENLVERIFDPADRRIIYIKLTENGKESFKIIKQSIGQEMRQRITTLDEEKIKKLLDYTQYVRDTLSEIMKDNSHDKNLCCK